jgi:hypothetical protein
MTADSVLDAQSHRMSCASRDYEDGARQAKALTKDEAGRIAINVVRWPELLGQADRDCSIPAREFGPCTKCGMVISADVRRIGKCGRSDEVA